MFLFTQIALNVSELVRVSGSTEEWRERADPHGFLLKAGAMATVAGAVFCELLENFEECALAAIERFDQTGSWVSAASAVCSARGLPDYKASIEVGIRRMERYLEEQRPVRRTGSDPLDFVLHTSKKVMLRGLENLLAHEAANARPLTSPGRIPFPKCLAFSKDGERHLLGIGFAWCPPPVEFVEVSKTALAWSLEEERVLEGLCNEREIPCYPPIEDDALAQVFAVWPCDDFERCRRVWAAGRRGFCTNEGWQERRERKSLLRRLVPR